MGSTPIPPRNGSPVSRLSELGRLGHFAFRSIGFLVYWFPSLPASWSPGLPVYWFSDLLVYWFPGLPVYWFPGLPVYWFPGLPVNWSPGLPVYWFPGLLVSRPPGLLASAPLMQNILLNVDAGPLRIERMAVHPYPDLQRLWVRVQLSHFAEPPNVRLVCMDADGREAAEMLLVEWREPYISLTMHLRQPQPGASYTLRAEVARDQKLLDTCDHPFALVFTEPTEDGES